MLALGLVACSASDADPGAQAGTDTTRPDEGPPADAPSAPDTVGPGADATAPDTFSEPDATEDTPAPPPDEGADAADTTEPEDSGPQPECTSNADCDDSDACTKDSCTDAGKCHNLGIPGCKPCLGEGDEFEDFETDGKCCEGLTAIPACIDTGNGDCACPNCPCFVCTSCGDGKCGEDENACNCGEDCKGPKPSECVSLGGICVDDDVPIPWELVCPAGTEAAPYGGCKDGQICCAPAMGCIGPGGKMDLSTGAAECCEGLTSIPYALWDPSGSCGGTFDVSICSACGDGTCEDWENPCNCDKDCTPAVPCNGPLTPCPEGQYCKNPDATCDLLGVMGSCVEIPEACDLDYAPVCGCDAKTYGNLCAMEAASMSMSYKGKCVEGCLGVGEFWNEVSLPGCCPGLGLMAPCTLSMGGCACDDVVGGICGPCGDGVCDEKAGEDPCSCKSDCDSTVENACEKAGGKCTPDGPFGEGCDEDMVAAPYGGCGFSETCCVPEDEEGCVSEGGTVGIYPGALPCCDGLVQIPVSEPISDPTSSGCIGKLGAAWCSACGNGFCESDWENVCNCPEDCEEDTGKTCKPGGSPCPTGQYCMFAPGKCLTAGQYGKCTEIPGECPDTDEPVCGCDGSTYLNACEMQMSEVTKAYDGDCVEDCYGDGEKFMDFETEGLCCPGLVAVPDCMISGDGDCSCPKCPCYVCTACGDGVCDPETEHKCNCPEDCEVTNPLGCKDYGGFCEKASPDSSKPPCPDGTVPSSLGGCPPDSFCCTKGPFPPPDEPPPPPDPSS